MDKKHIILLYSFIFYLLFVFNFVLIFKLRKDPSKDIFMTSLSIMTSSERFSSNGRIEEKNNATKSQDTRHRYEKNVFVVVICRGEKNISATHKPLQFEQSIVLIKSALALTSEVLRFVILTESRDLFTDLEGELLEIIGTQYKRNLVLEYRTIMYPEGRKDMHDFFKPCATARFFVPQLLDFDSAIYLDTDTMFMRPPEHLWKVFEKFKHNQLIGFTETRGFYNVYDFKFPWYGDTGLNSGVMLMNLSRIDHFPGGWIDSLYGAFDQYKLVLYAGDQDVLNIVFSYNPTLVHDIGCDWNFCGTICNQERVPCRRAEKNGVSLIHGNAQTLYLGYLEVIFNAWKDHEMGTSLQEMWTEIDLNAGRIDPTICGNVRNIKTILTKWARENILTPKSKLNYSPR